MELNESEKIAAAALFTLALHQTQVEVGVDNQGSLLHKNSQAWGCPPDLDICDFLTDPEIGRTSDCKFWGWDCYGPRGICQQFFNHLDVPKEKRVGLLILPGIVQDSSLFEGVEKLLELVQSYGSILDPDLESVDGSAEMAAIELRRLNDTNFTSNMKASNAEPDNKSCKEIRECQDNGCQDELQRVTSFDSFEFVDSGMSLEGVIDPIQTRTVSGQSSSGPVKGQELAAVEEARDNGMQVSTPKNWSIEDKTGELHDVCPRQHNASAKSCAALQMMLEACIMIPSEQGGKGSGGLWHEEVQWYDSRCRVALKRVARWLGIPLKTHAALENTLASFLLGLRQDGSLKPSSKSISRWVKVGAAAVGGGAAIALTAPAIALGLGSAVSLVGGGAATATAVSGFAASAAGTATITGAFGAIGASHTGKGMARRTGNVQEFGFWDISTSWEPESKDSKPIVKKSAYFTTPKVRFKSFFGASKKSQESGPSEFSLQSESTTVPVGASNLSSNAASTVTPLDTNSIPSSPVHEECENSSTPTQNGLKLEQNALEQSRGGTEVIKTSKLDPDVGIKDLEEKEQASLASWVKSWAKAKKRKPLLTCPVNPSRPEWNLGLAICVTGWVQKYEDFVDPWESLSGLDTDRFALVWEAKELKEVGDALMSLIRSQIAGQAAKWFVTRYLYAGLVQAVAFPLLLLSLTSMTIDNIWLIAQDRACKAGVLLAQCLVEGLHGRRPVTLISFSLGARLIFYCLLELSKMGKVGIVENVVLMGTAVSLTESKWCAARSVVSGRFINCYCQNDWVLGITFRASKGFVTRAAGCCPVNVPGVENIDLTSLVEGHTDYVAKMDRILAYLKLN